MRIRVFAAWALIACLSGCNNVGVRGSIPPVAVAGGRMSPRPLSGWLVLPAGSGKRPVVILLHGCGGIAQNLDFWVARVNSWGYGALVLDSFTPRGVRTVCESGNQGLVTYADRAADTIATVRWLQTQPGVDSRRIAMIGFSHGGRTAAAVDDVALMSLEGGAVRGLVDYYATCGDPNRFGGIPMLALAGDADTSDPARSCRKFGEALPAGAPFQLVVYPGAAHSFDTVSQDDRSRSESPSMQADRAAARDSFVRVRDFLASTIGMIAAPKG